MTKTKMFGFFLTLLIAALTTAATPVPDFLDTHGGEYHKLTTIPAQWQSLSAVPSSGGRLFQRSAWRSMTAADNFTVFYASIRDGIVSFDLRRDVPAHGSELIHYKFKKFGIFLNAYKMDAGTVYVYNASDEPVAIGSYDATTLSLNDSVDDPRPYSVLQTDGSVEQVTVGKQLIIKDLGDGRFRFTLSVRPGSPLLRADEAEGLVSFVAIQL